MHILQFELSSRVNYSTLESFAYPKDASSSALAMANANNTFFPKEQHKLTQLRL